MKYKRKSIREIRDALVKMSWDVNNNKPSPLLVVYPNEILLELFGKEGLEDYWIKDEMDQ